MPPPLPHLVGRLVESLVASLGAAANPALQPFIDGIRGVACHQAMPIVDPCRDHPALRHLGAALGALRAEPALCAAVQALAPHLSFGSTYAQEGKLAALAQGMVWAEVAGPLGLVRDTTRRLGVFLLAPELHYPLHGHVADEIYFGLSGTLLLEHGLEGERVALGPGQCYRTPSGHAHALHVGAEPVLLAYCWMGNFSVPTWFYERDDTGRWTTTESSVVRR